MLEHGYSAGLVIYTYGDICQAITELAKEKQVHLTLDEFGTLSRLLDNAMADAVAALAGIASSPEPAPPAMCVSRWPRGHWRSDRCSMRR